MTFPEGEDPEASSNAPPNHHSIPLSKSHESILMDDSDEWEYEYSTTETEVGFTAPVPKTLNANLF